MSDSHNEFRQRVARVYEKREQIARSSKKTRAVYSAGQDGYTVIRGRARRRPFPWTGLMLVLVAFFGVKGAVMARLGPDFYTQQISQLSPATLLEQAGAWTMRPDPVSRWVARTINSMS